MGTKGQQRGRPSRDPVERERFYLEQAKEKAKLAELEKLQTQSRIFGQGQAGTKAPSKRIIDKIKVFEGFSADPYIDGAGVAIGYGHYLGDGISGLTHLPIDRAQGEIYLVGDLKHAEDAVNRLIDVKLSQDQYDALISWTYNLGEKNLQTSTLRKKINKGAPKEEIVTEFMKWDNAKVNGVMTQLEGLTKRRKYEADLFTGTEQQKRIAKGVGITLTVILFVVLAIWAYRRFIKPKS